MSSQNVSVGFQEEVEYPQEAVATNNLSSALLPTALKVNKAIPNLQRNIAFEGNIISTLTGSIAVISVCAVFAGICVFGNHGEALTALALAIIFNVSLSAVFKYMNRNKLVSGCQGWAYGPTHEDRVHEIYGILERNQPEGIKYNKNKISYYVEGGNCSAMALDLAANYLKMKRECGITEQTSLQELIDRIKILVEEYPLSTIDDGALVQEFRNRQVAFNCIEVDKSKNIDFSLAKVQSIVNFHSLQISDSTRETKYLPSIYSRLIALSPLIIRPSIHLLSQQIKNIYMINSPTICSLSQQVKSLSYGVHFLRFIAPADNEKLEFHGHSMIFIKEQQGAFFYDPNFGIEIIKNNVANRLDYHFENNQETFEITDFRFYTVNEKQTT